RVQMLLGIDDLDDQREVCGELQDAGGVQDRIRAKASHAAQDGGAGQMLRPEQLDQRGVERSPLPLVAFADEDPPDDLLALDPSHAYPRPCSTSRPTAMPRKHRPSAMAVVTAMLSQACDQAFASISRTVS